MKRTTFALGLVLFLSTVSFGQIPVASSIYSFWDSPQAVVIRGDYAYVTARNGQLYTLDISDVEQPRVCSSIDLGTGLRLRPIIIGDRLWTFSNRSYCALSLEDPVRPALLLETYNYERIEGIATDGCLLVVASSRHWVQDHDEWTDRTYEISDVSDLQHPRQLFNQTNRFFAPGSVLKDSLLWGSYEQNLYAVSLQNPAQPGFLVRTDFPLNPLAANAQGDVLYCLDKLNSRLTATDISDPEQPAVIAAYPDFGAITSPVFEDTLVSFLYGDSRFACLNLADPAAPEVLIDQQIEQGGFALGLGGEKGAMIDSAGLINFYRREDFDSFEYMTCLDYCGVIQDVKVVGNRAYVAAGVSGLRIVDVSDIDDPHELGYLLLPAPAIGVTANDDQTAYVSTADSGIYICSVSNPEQITILGRQPVATMVSQLEIHGSYLFYYKSYILGSPGGLFVLDVQDPRRPAIVSTLNMKLFAIEGDLLYGLEEQGIAIVDISNPLELQIVRRFRAYGGQGFQNFMPAGRYFYYQYQDAIIIRPGDDTHWKCLAKIDLADPDTAILRNVWTWGETPDMHVDGDILSRKDNYFIFAASNWAGIYAENRGNFVGINTFVNASSAMSVDISGTTVYLTLGNTLAIYDCSDYLRVLPKRQEIPEAMVLQAFPNPFNSSVFITFSTPNAGVASLSLTDLSGRAIRSWFEPVSHPGEFKFTIDGDGLTTGVYWVNVRQGGNVASRRIVLVK